jgi:ADP-ribosylglycohydrolase
VTLADDKKKYAQKAMNMHKEAISGCILGTAIGDAMGLPYEGLSPGRARRLFTPLDRYHLLFNRGLVSDDTEYTCMVAQALIFSGGDVDIFTGDLARRFRYWLLHCNRPGRIFRLACR